MEMNAMNVKHVLTTCPYCGTGCNFFLQVVEDKLISVVPCKTDEISRGQLCIKGDNAHAFVQHPDRLKTPLAREHGELRQISWEDALDRLAKEIRRIKEKYGPDSIAFLASAKSTNEENFLFQKLARGIP